MLIVVDNVVMAECIWDLIINEIKIKLNICFIAHPMKGRQMCLCHQHLLSCPLVVIQRNRHTGLKKEICLPLTALQVHNKIICVLARSKMLNTSTGKPQGAQWSVIPFLPGGVQAVVKQSEST